MKYIIKNIKTFIKTEKMIFLLILLCVVTSSFIINFSYGLYQNYNVKKEEAESTLYDLDIPIVNSENAFVSKSELKNTLLSFSDGLNKNIDMYYVIPVLDEYASYINRVTIRFCINQGKIVPCEVSKKNMLKYSTLVSGRYFSEQEEKDGERVALVHDDIGSVDSFTEKIMIDSDTVLFQGHEFKIIGMQRLHPLIVPFNSLDGNTLIDILAFHFQKPLTRSQYNEIKEKLETSFGDAVQVPELDIPKSQNYYLYNTIILISVLIAVLAAINFAFLYRYLLSKRAKTLAVYRICGCTKAKALGMFLGECMLIAVPAFALTTLAYDKLALPKLALHFEYMESAYSPKLYLLISAIYIIVTFAVLMLMINFGFLNKKIAEAKGE